MSAVEVFDALDYEDRMLLEMEDWMYANGAPKKMIKFIHGMIKESLGECTMKFFLLKDPSWRKH